MIRIFSNQNGVALPILGKGEAFPNPENTTPVPIIFPRQESGKIPPLNLDLESERVASGFKTLAQFADAADDLRTRRKAVLYDGYHWLTVGNIDEAVARFRSCREEFPEAAAILKRLDADRLKVSNLAALEAWEVYLREAEAGQKESDAGLLARFFSNESSLNQAREKKFGPEKRLVQELRRKIESEEAETLLLALQQLKENGNQEERGLADFLLSDDAKRYVGDPRSALLAFAAAPAPTRREADALAQRTAELGRQSPMPGTCLAVRSLLQTFSSDSGQEGSGDASKSDSEQFAATLLKLAMESSPEAVAGDVLLMFASAGLGNLTKLALLEKSRRAGLTGYRAIALASAGGIATESTALWAGNAGKASLLQDPNEVLKAERLAKSYGATLLTIAGLKGFARLGEALGPGFRHPTGLSGMVATGQLNQALGLHERPAGGLGESLAGDLFSYLEFAVAYGAIDGAFAGKMSRVAGEQQRRIAEQSRVLSNPLAERQRLLSAARNPLLAPMWAMMAADFGGWDAPPEDVLRQARLAEAKIGKPETTDEAMKTLNRLIPKMGPDQALELAKIVELKLKGEEFGSEPHQLILCELLKHLRPEDLLPRIEKLEELYWIGNDALKSQVIWVMGAAIELLPSAQRLDRLVKLESITHKNCIDKTVLEDAEQTMISAFSSLSPENRKAWIGILAERSNGADYSRRQRAAKVLRASLSPLPLPERLEALRQILHLGVSDNNAAIFSSLLLKIPEAALKAHAERHQDPELNALALYQSSKLPFDSFLWREYRQASNTASHLEKLASEIEQYRRGKELPPEFTERESHLAYAGLDSPEGLDHSTFSMRLRRPTELPPTFLSRSFDAEIMELTSWHGLIDKGKFRDAVASALQITDLKFAKHLTELIHREKGAMKSIKTELIEVFPNGVDNLTFDEMHLAAQRLLPKIWTNPAPPVQELASHLLLMLGWCAHDPLMRVRIVEAAVKNVPSEALVESLQSLEEFYRDGLSDVLRGLGLPDHPPPLIRKHRRLLQQELQHLKPSESRNVRVEFLPSKTKADRYFGYVGEDCTKDRGQAIESPDFQVYRMLADGRLTGMVYVQKAELDGKKVLVLAIQPRTFWKVDHPALLGAIESNFAKIAAEEGYDCVLMMEREDQRSNRQDMLSAIKRRNFEKIAFSHSPTGGLFEGKEFLLLWKKPDAESKPH